MAAKQGGQLIRRGERTWLVRVYDGCGADGRRRYLNKTIHGTKKEARAYLGDQLAKQNRGELVRPSPESVGAFLDRWLESCASIQVRQRTLRDYGQVLRLYVRPTLGGHRLRDLRAEYVQELYSSMVRKGLSPRTVQLTHAILSQALTRAVHWKLIPFNPATLVTLPKKRELERSVLDATQVAEFLKAAENDLHGVVFAFALATGMRPSEYLALRWQDLDLEAGMASVRRSLSWVGKDGWRFDEPKTRRSRRTIPLPPTMVRALRVHRARQAEERLAAGPAYGNNDLVFATPIGTPLDIHNLSRRHFKRLLETARLPETTRLYDLRHTAATLLIGDNLDARTVADRLGHANVSMTLGTYTHPTSAMQRAAAEKLEVLLFSRQQ